MREFSKDKSNLNTCVNKEVIYEFRLIVLGTYPIYLLLESILTEQVLMSPHVCILPRGVTMVLARSTYNFKNAS